MSKKTTHTYKLQDCKLIKVTIKKLINSREYDHLNLLNNLDQINVPQLIHSLSNKQEVVYRFIKGKQLFKEYPWLWKQDLNVRLELFKNILNVVKVIHQHPQKIIHNDISPDNILIYKKKNAFLIDFDNATSNLTSNKIVTYGKPHYASPEQKNGLPTSQQSDIYQLGCLLFELIFKKQYQDINDTPQYDLSGLTVDTKLRSILISFLSEEPKGRCQNIKECIELIDRFYK